MNRSATACALRPSLQRGCIRSRAVSGRKMALAISLCSSFNSAREPARGGLSGGGLELFLDKLVRLKRLPMDFCKRRNAIVPFQQSGCPSYQFDGVRIKFPDGIEHRMIMRIKNIFLKLGVTRDVDLPDAIMRNVV